MEENIVEMVLDMLEAETPLSRNKNFQLYEDEQRMRVFRYFKMFRSVARDIEACGSPSCIRVRRDPEAAPGELMLMIRDEAVRYTRMVRVPARILDHYRRQFPGLLPKRVHG